MANEEQNLQVVQGFYNSFLDGTLFDYISENFTPDVEYTVITPTMGVNNPSDYSDETFTHERQALVPFTRFYIGIPEVQGFFADLLSRYDVVDFRTDKFVVDGNNVAVFGGLSYRNQDTGNGTDLLPLAVDIEIRDGKIAKYDFYEDAYSFAATARQGGTWTRIWDGKPLDVAFGTNDEDILTGGNRSDLIYGYQSDDALNGSKGNDTLWGGSGDDVLNGGDGEDALYGNEGRDILTGGSRRDLFELAVGEGTDIITDFGDGDKLGLAGSLTFEQLEITQNGSDVEISIADSEEILASLTGVAEGDINESDFDLIPNAERTTTENVQVAEGGSVPDEARNKQVVEGFYASFLDDSLFDYISENFTQDVEYTVNSPTLGVNNPSDYSDETFTHERQALIPLSGLHTGISEVNDFFRELLRNYDVLDLQTDKLVVDGNNVSVFGDISYRNKATGNGTDLLPFAVDIEIRDGKIAKYHFYQDSYSFAATARQGGEWTRIWDGEPLDVAFGTNDEDILTGSNRSDLIYGYQSDDALNAGEGNDTLWGGSGDDALNGGSGDDAFYGNEGRDILTGGAGGDQFWIATSAEFPGDETNMIADFELGVDVLGIGGTFGNDLDEFSDLTLTQDGANTIVSGLGKDLAVLLGIERTSLSASNFVFS